MPCYEFKHPEEERYVEIIMTMNETHEYTEDGVQWERVFSIPTASVDTKINHNSATDFAEKTGKKKGNIGDILSASREASDKRASERGGIDPVKQKYYDDYAKKRSGTRSVQEIKDKIPKKFVI